MWADGDVDSTDGTLEAMLDARLERVNDGMAMLEKLAADEDLLDYVRHLSALRSRFKVLSQRNFLHSRIRERDEAPEAIRATAEFSDLCPASAVLMSRSLA